MSVDRSKPAIERWWERTMQKRVKRGSCISCGRDNPHETRHEAKQVTANGALLCGLCVVSGWDSLDQLAVYERRAGMVLPVVRVVDAR